MDARRSEMTARVVPFGSAESADSRVGGTPTERVALVVELSARLWRHTGKPLPSYTRATIPVHVTALSARHDRE